jgi:PPM family protein phosphatase
VDAVKLLTIGEFARLARLSQKALRLYDELGLLPPFRVDEWSGYRYYAPSQLERARLVAWLRRAGMPLAQIGTVLGAPNQDVGYAGPQLIAVADGFGPGGERASAATVEALRRLESEPAPDAGTAPAAAAAVPAGMVPADLLNVLSDALSAASDSVRSISASDPELDGSGSTLTAMLLSGSRLALVHIGDSRAYLFRDGGLFQVTHDHSVTQSMIDAGRLTPEEAASHPQRSLLLRAVGASAAEMTRAGVAQEHARMAGTPDLSLLDARIGDRYLITSDGLTNVVPDSVIRQALSAVDLSPAEVIRRLITLANEAGGPDNIALALADIVAAA